MLHTVQTSLHGRLFHITPTGGVRPQRHIERLHAERTEWNRQHWKSTCEGHLRYRNQDDVSGRFSASDLIANLRSRHIERLHAERTEWNRQHWKSTCEGHLRYRNQDDVSGRFSASDQISNHPDLHMGKVVFFGETRSHCKRL